MLLFYVFVEVLFKRFQSFVGYNMFHFASVLCSRLFVNTEQYKCFGKYGVTLVNLHCQIHTRVGKFKITFWVNGQIAVTLEYAHASADARL